MDMTRKCINSHAVLLFTLLIILITKDFVSAGFCYKKYLKRQGKCVKEFRNKGGLRDMDYEKCCRLKRGKGWKPYPGSQICIQCHKIVDGGWSQWTKWTECPVKCDWGKRTRERECNSPVPQHGGSECKGANTQRSKCYAGVRCPINGNWGSWSKWSICSKSCKPGGLQLRSRRCDNPKPQFEGHDCLGPSEESKGCNEDRHCPVDGSWGSWSSWSSCNARCDRGSSGNMTRSRKCDRPKPQFNGKYCSGNAIDTLLCFRKCVETTGTGSGSGSGKSDQVGSGSASGEDLEVDVENGFENRTKDLLKNKNKKVTEINPTSGSASGEGSGDSSGNEDSDVRETVKKEVSTKIKDVKEESGGGYGSGSDKGINKTTDEDSESGDITEGSGRSSGDGSSGRNDPDEISVESAFGKKTTKKNNQPVKENASEPGWGDKFTEIN